MTDYPVRWDEDTSDCGACYVLARYIEDLHERIKQLEDAARPTTSTDSEDYSNLMPPRTFGPAAMMVEYEDGTVERIDGVITDAKVAEVRSKSVKRWWITR